MKRRPRQRPAAPKPKAPPEPQSFYVDSTVERVGDSVCLTFHALDDGREVEVWMPLSSAGTAAMTLLEVSFDRRIARQVQRRADRAAYLAWLREDPTREPQDWGKAEP